LCVRHLATGPFRLTVQPPPSDSWSQKTFQGPWTTLGGWMRYNPLLEACCLMRMSWQLVPTANLPGNGIDRLLFISPYRFTSALGSSDDSNGGDLPVKSAMSLTLASGRSFQLAWFGRELTGGDGSKARVLRSAALTAERTAVRPSPGP